MPVFLTLCFIAVSAYVTVVLHGCGCASSTEEASPDDSDEHRTDKQSASVKSHGKDSSGTSQKTSEVHQTSEFHRTDQQLVSEEPSEVSVDDGPGNLPVSDGLPLNDSSGTSHLPVSDGIHDKEPAILNMDPANGCLATDIDMGSMPENDLAPSYSAIGAVQFLGFKGKDCCVAMKGVAKVFMLAGRDGASPDEETAQKEAKAVETCGSPTEFDVVIGIQGSRPEFKGDRKTLAEHFCEQGFPTAGYALPGYATQKGTMGIEGISDAACTFLEKTVKELDAYNNQTIGNVKAKEHKEAADAAQEQFRIERPDVFALKFELTFTKTADPTATLEGVTGSMVEVPGASAQHMASVASPLPAKRRPNAGDGGRANRPARVLGAALALDE